MGINSSNLIGDKREANSIARLNELYEQVFDTEHASQQQQLTISEIRSKVKEMMKLLRKSDSQDSQDRSTIDRRVRLLDWIMKNDSCLVAILESRIAFEQQESTHLNLGPFIKFYNRKQFERCAKKLDDKLNVSANAAFRTNIGQVSQIIRKKIATVRGVDMSNRDVSVFEAYFRLISQGVLEYLSKQLAMDIDKPEGISMKEFNSDMVSKIENTFKYECSMLDRQNHTNIEVYQAIMLYEPELRHQFRPKVVTLMENLISLCPTLLSNVEYVYALGRFDLHALTDIIFDTRSASQQVRASKIADLLDISTFVGQAQLTMAQTGDEILVQKLIDLLEVSQIRPDKCFQDYFAKIVDLKQVYGNYPNLIKYLDHYGKLQLVECEPVLKSVLKFEITTITSSSTGEESSGLILLDELVKIMDEIRMGSNSIIRLYQPIDIPYDKISLGIQRFMKNHGVSILDSRGNVNVQLFMEKAERLFDICNIIKQNLRSSAKRFQDLVVLDSGPEGVMSDFVLQWMTRYAICANILRLPRETRISTDL